MITSQHLKGLMTFLDRKEWSERFDLTLADHFSAVQEAADMEFKNIVSFVGEQWAGPLWGCVFEDFLTQEFEAGGGNVVDVYLKQRGWRESTPAKAYMKALRNSVMSLYEVSEVVAGKSLMARDLLRGGEPVLVMETTATKALTDGDLLAARVVFLKGENNFTGGLLPYSQEATNRLFDALRQVFGDAKPLSSLDNKDLQGAAPMFTISWLFDRLKRKATKLSLKNGQG